jgi:hypothetical protein
METIYLPGDRDIFALADAIARDNRLTHLELLAKLAAYRCNIRREWTDCGPARPCLYCKDLK